MKAALTRETKAPETGDRVMLSTPSGATFPVTITHVTAWQTVWVTTGADSMLLKPSGRFSPWLKVMYYVNDAGVEMRLRPIERTH